MSLTINQPAASSRCVPATARELQEFITRTIGIDDSAESSGAIITIGPDRPTENTDRERRIHLKQDANGAVVAIEYYALGRWNVFAQAVRGECRYFFAGAAPQGWKPCDGTEGTLNVKEDQASVYSPMANGSLVLHQFTGIF